MKEIQITFKSNMDGSFDEPEAKRAMLADAAYSALWHIGQEIFRPARKHGYADTDLNKLLAESCRGSEIISLLEKKFYDILGEQGIDLDALWK